MSLKIFLITPPYHCGILEVAGTWTPLGFVYLAGELRAAGHNPVIYDAMTLNHDLNQIVERIIAEQPDVVALTAFTASFPATMDVLMAVKQVNPEITTVLGGVHATFMYEEIFSQYPELVDFVIRGEGERTIVELAEALSGTGKPLAEIAGLAYPSGDGLVVTPKRRRLSEAELDSLKPAWDLLNWDDYRYFMVPGSTLAVISSSRGCEENCSFCSQQKFWEQSWRGRTPESVISEIVHLNDEYGVNVFMFADEYPTKDRKRWEAILDGIIALDREIYFLMETRVEDIVRDADILWKYKKAKVIHVYVGVEAADQEGLDKFNKNIKVEESREALRLLKEAKIISETSFILGTPDETKGSISKTLQQAIEYDPDFAHFLMLSPWPYADMYQELEPHIVTKDYSKYNLIEPVIEPKNLSIQELHKEMLACYRKFYLQKLPKWDKMEDDFNKKYLLNSMKEMLTNSFLKTHMKGLGQMPAVVEKYVKKLLA
ncbi:MAG: cobalamin B12-binding domain-containing protein [Firmicutes bacterium]|nr:cobalamin B12-binding domain-containing protein [Bacillota bacterium]